MNEIAISIIVVAIVAYLLFININKITNKYDTEEMLEKVNFSKESTDKNTNKNITNEKKYDDFINEIEKQIRNLKLQELNFKQNKDKESYLNELSKLNRDLTLINGANIENDLFKFLKKLEETNEEYLLDNDVINDNLRNNLMKAFKKI